jgi:hypothetical protein
MSAAKITSKKSREILNRNGIGQDSAFDYGHPNNNYET